MIRSPRVLWAQVLCALYCLWKFQRILSIHDDRVLKKARYLIWSRKYLLIASESGRVFYAYPGYSADSLMRLAQRCFGGKIGIRTR